MRVIYRTGRVLYVWFCLIFLFSKATFVDMHLHVSTSPMYPEGQSSKTYRVCNFFNRFVPKDNDELLSEDPNTFEYLYAQVSYFEFKAFNDKGRAKT